MSQIIGKGGIFDAVAKGDTRTVLALVKNGTNPNTANKSGETPVWVAASLATQRLCRRWWSAAPK